MEFPAYVSTSGVREDHHQLAGEFQMPLGRSVGTGIEADNFGRCDVFKYRFFGDVFSADDGSRGNWVSFQNSRIIE